MSEQPTISELQPVVGVTVAFTALYFAFLYTQSFSKFYLYFKAKAKDPKISFAKVKYGSTELLAVTTDRTVGNMMEQSIPFLTSLWLCAIFESADYAAKLGWLWLLFRALYPFAYYRRPWVLVSTVPGYIILFMLISPVARKAVFFSHPATI